MAEPTPSEQAEQYKEITKQQILGLIEMLPQIQIGQLLSGSFVDAKGNLLGTALNALSEVGVKLASVIEKAEDAAAPAFSRLAAAAVSDLFGTDVSAAAFGNPKDRGARAGVATDICAALLRGLGSQTGELQPGDEGAKRYLSMVVQLGLEGWLDGWMFELLTSLVPFLEIGHIERFADLDDTLAQSLGLPRLSRRVLSPLIDATVVTPFEWQIQKQYRPRLLTTSEAVRQFVRGRWSREQLEEELARQGFSPDRIEALANAAARFHSVADVELLVRAGQWTRAQAVQHLRDQGYEESVAETELALEKLKRIAAFERQLAGVAIEAYADRRIGGAELDDAIDGSTFDNQERAQLREIAETRRALRIKRISESDAEQMVLRGILSMPDYRRVLEREGYPPEDVLNLELLLRARLNDQAKADELRAQQAAERAAEKARRDAERAARERRIEGERPRAMPSASQVKTAVVRGILTLDDYRRFLLEQRFDAGDVDFLVAIAEQERDERLEQERRRAAAAARTAERDVSLNDLETAVVEGITDLDTYRRELEALGFDAGERALLVALLEDRIAAKREAALRREEAGRELAARGLSLSQLEDAVQRGLRSVADYRRELELQRFTPDAVATLVAQLEQELEEAAAARARRAAEQQPAGPRELTMQQLERAVVAGVTPIEDYERFLVQNDFAVDAQQTLMALLRQEAAAAAAARARRDQVDEELAPRDVPIATYARAAKLGILTPAQYREVLARAGYSADDQALLTEVLLVELQDVRRAEARREEIERELGTRELSLGQVERSVRAGVQSVDDYRAFVLGAGYTTADAELLVQLLETQLAAKAGAESRRAKLVEQLAGRGVDLEALERDVVAGAVTLDDYTRLLSGAGVKPEDLGLLVQLLVPQLGEAA